MPRLFLVLVVFSLLATPALAETRWEFTLDGETAGSGSSASGTGVFILNDAMTEVTFDIRYYALLGVETGSHVHNGGPGMGERIFNLPNGPIKQGVWVLDGRDLEVLLGGFAYVNVHTDIYAQGEIRGNATLGSVPVEAATWSGVKALFR